MKNRLLLLGTAAALALSSATSAQTPPPAGAIQVAPGDVVQLDYLRYEGRYYEIARLYNRRERNCGSDVVVTFVRRIEGDVSFVNQCITNDKSWIMDIGRLVTTGTDQRPG